MAAVARGARKAGAASWEGKAAGSSGKGQAGGSRRRDKAVGQKHLGEVRGKKELKRKSEGVTVEETAEERRGEELAANAGESPAASP